MDQNILYFFLGIGAGIIVNIIGLLAVEWIREFYIRYLLMGGHFVGVQWQRDLFDSLGDVVCDHKIPLKKLYDIVCEIKNWTKRDLLKCYSPVKINRFFTDRENVDMFYQMAYASSRLYDEDNTEISKRIKKIHGRINAALNEDILPEISNLQSKEPTPYNIEMATAAAKSKKLDDLLKMRDELIKIRARVAKIRDLKSEINDEQSK